MGAGAALVLAQLPKSLFANALANNMEVGFQTFPVREMLSKDFSGTLKTIAGMGYRITEMCSPKGYENAGFGALIKMKPQEIKKTIEDAGLKCPSCHFGFSELNEHLDDRIDFAKQMGLSHVVCSSFGLPDTATINDYVSAAQKLNTIGEKVKQAGMQCGFHNHSTEFKKLDGNLIYDELLNTFDKDLVKLQFQTEVVNLGYQAADYFDKYPGRFISSHLSDWTDAKKQAAIGKGVIDWKKFFASAKKSGVKYFFVEMDLNTFKDSAAYIKTV